MTTLTIVFISTTIYLIIAFIWCFIASMDTVLEAEELVYCLLWIIVMPYILIKGFISRLKNNKKKQLTNNKKYDIIYLSNEREVLV